MKFVVTETIVRVVEANDPQTAINTRSEGVAVEFRIDAEPSKEARTAAGVEAACQMLLPVVQAFREGMQAQEEQGP